VSETFGFSTGSYPYTLDLKGVVWAENDYYNGERKTLQALVSNVGINAGPLPDDITNLTVSGPSFNHTFTQIEIRWSRQVGNVYAYYELGFPQNGTWQFNIQDRFGNSDDYSKDQTSDVIPMVDYMSMSPANNAYLHTLTPTFSWDAVPGGPWYYRIRIMDWKTWFTTQLGQRRLRPQYLKGC